MEMAILFPLTFLCMMLLLQSAITLTVKLYTCLMGHQAVMLLEQALEKGCSSQTGMEAGDARLWETLGSVSGLEADWQWTKEEGFLEESFSLHIDASYNILTAAGWQQDITTRRMDPVTFRNRVDLVAEILEEYVDE